MNPIAMCAPLIFGLSLTSPVVGADDPLVLPVWPGKVPGDYGEIGSEQFRSPRCTPPPRPSPTTCTSTWRARSTSFST